MGNCTGRSANCDNSSAPFASSKKPLNSCNTSISTASSKTTLTPLPSYFTSFRSEESLPFVSLKSFTLNELKSATRNFRSDSYLGEGGFGIVFKGWIDENSYTPTKPGVGIVVAIKKLRRESFQGHREWLAEVTYLGQLRHKNLVKLIGYCSESDNKLLVYEYMQRGSLENHLFKRGTQQLSWATRVNIAIDVAHGLSFLHNLETQVIYRDLKGSNILLDADFNAKLSDFGLARNGPTGDKTHVSTRVVGTRGYAAPEYVSTGTCQGKETLIADLYYHVIAWKLFSEVKRRSSFMPGHLSIKSDIYSFGVVLLELLSGRRALHDGRGVDEDSLVDWAKPFLDEKRRMLRIMDTRLEGCYSKKGAQSIAVLALQCLHDDPRNRPNMAEVLATLEEFRVPTKGLNHQSFPSEGR